MVGENVIRETLNPNEARNILKRLAEVRLSLVEELEKLKPLSKEDEKVRKQVEELEKRLQTMPSILLLGPPGVEKTEIVWELAKELAESMGRELLRYGRASPEKIKEVLDNPDKYFVFVNLRLYEMEPADLLGIPRAVEGGYTVYMPPAWAVLLSKCPGILLLDEITNVQRPDVLAAAYKVANERVVGEISFHDGVTVIAAGDVGERGSVAVPLPTPLASRFFIAYMRSPTIDEWFDYMERTFGDEWDKRTYAFLKAFESENLLTKPPEEPETANPYPSPRSWTKLAVMLYELPRRGFQLTDDMIRKLAVMALGTEVGIRFAEFLKAKASLDELLKDPSVFKNYDRSREQ